MENRENKIIADKINSLDYLPEGYQPNLDAKWALLQGENKKAAPVFLFERKTWLKIAACLIILLMSGIIWMNTPSKSKIETAIIKPSSIVPEASPSIQITNSAENTAYLHSKQLNKKPKRTIKNHTVVFPEQKPAQHELLAIEKNVIDSAIGISEKIESPVAEIKSKKPRYVQIDFEDQAIPANDKNTFAQGFQFRIGIKNSGVIDRSPSDNSSLKLKRNF